MSLGVLVLARSDEAAAPLVDELRRSGYAVDWLRVDSGPALRSALEGPPWKVILAEYRMPGLSALEALALIKERALDVPLVVVQAPAGAEGAVEAMRAGADEYLVEPALSRLPAVVERALREAAERTEQRQRQEELLVSDRIASVSTLAGGVAHQINDPLAALMANVDFSLETLAALDRHGARTEVEAPLREAREAAERIRLIVRDLRIFSRLGEHQRDGAVDLCRVLESSLRMAWGEVRHRARLVKSYGEIPPVRGNEAGLGQVFVNLIVNAAQAIAEAGTDDNEIRLTTRLERDRVVVEVQDTGLGIAAELMPRMFDPFFTSRPAGVGAGLRLAICQRIVAALGGAISAQSEPGRGNLFRVELPVADVVSGDRTEEIIAAPAPGRRGQVLVIDDEPMIGKVVQRMLAADHEVTSVASAREALDLLGSGSSFDVILCDLVMPELSGMDLHSTLLRTNPAMAERMVFMTGGAFTAAARAYLDRVPHARIEKPFDGPGLRLLIQRLLREADR
jgi:signal transduction histidine kinase